MTPVWFAWTAAPAVVAAEGWASLDPASIRRASLVCRLCSITGDGPRVRAAARRNFEALIAAPDALPAQLTPPRPRRRRAAMDGEAASAALADLQNIASRVPLTPFLTFGSLLGLVRDGRLIPGDSDVDLGIFGAANLLRLHRAVREAELPVSAIINFAGRPSNFNMLHPNGCRLDLKAFEPETDGTLTWGLKSQNLRITKRYPRRFGLETMQFNGVEVSIPERPEEFLAWQYGPGWTVADPGYSVYSCGPLHGEEHAQFIDVTGSKAVLGALKSGMTAKAARIARGMVELYPEDPLWPRLAATIEACALSDPAGASGPGGSAPGR